MLVSTLVLAPVERKKLDTGRWLSGQKVAILLAHPITALTQCIFSRKKVWRLHKWRSGQWQKDTLFHWWDAIKICCSWRQLIALQQYYYFYYVFPRSTLVHSCWTNCTHFFLLIRRLTSAILMATRMSFKLCSLCRSQYKLIRSCLQQQKVWWIGTLLTPYQKIAATNTTQCDDQLVWLISRYSEA